MTLSKSKNTPKPSKHSKLYYILDEDTQERLYICRIRRNTNRLCILINSDANIYNLCIKTLKQEPLGICNLTVTSCNLTEDLEEVVENYNCRLSVHKIKEDYTMLCARIKIGGIIL